MSLPTTNVNTSNFDAGTDDPAQARADLLDLAQKFNQLRQHLADGGGLVSLVTSQTADTNITHHITVTSGKKALVMVSYSGGQAGAAGVQGDFQWGSGALANTRQFASGAVDYQTPFSFSMQTVIASTSSNLQVRLNSSSLDGGYGAPANFYLTVLEF